MKMGVIKPQGLVKSPAELICNSEIISLFLPKPVMTNAATLKIISPNVTIPRLFSAFRHCFPKLCSLYPFVFGPPDWSFFRSLFLSGEVELNFSFSESAKKSLNFSLALSNLSSSAIQID